MSWSIYTKRVEPIWHCSDDLLLTSSGFSVSRDLFIKMGKPAFCVLMIDEENQKVAFLPTSNDDEGMRLHNRGETSRCFLMAHNFIKENDLAKYAVQTYSVQTDGTLFWVELLNPLDKLSACSPSEVK